MLKTRRLCSIAILAIVICAMEKPVYADAKETWNHTLATTGFQQQERMDWCWVASARNMAVTKVSNVNVKKTQSDVVKSIKGSVKNCTGSLRDIRFLNSAKWAEPLLLVLPLFVLYRKPREGNKVCKRYCSMYNRNSYILHLWM